MAFQTSLPVSSVGTRRHLRGMLSGWVVFTTVLLIVGVIATVRYSSSESTDDAQVAGHILPVSARVNGAVVQILVENDQVVEAGQPLVIIDPTDFDTAVSEQSAATDESQASVQAAQDEAQSAKLDREERIASATEGLNAAKSRLHATVAQEQAVRAQVSAAEATDVQRQEDLQRNTALFQDHLISRQAYAVAVENAAVAARTLESVRAQLAAATANRKLEEANQQIANVTLEQAKQSIYTVDAARREIAVRRASLEQAETKLKQTKTYRQRTVIRAPVHGIVAARVVELGQNVQAGDVLLSVVDTSHLWVTANFKETQLRRLRLGEAASVVVDATGSELKGRVGGFGGGSGSIFSLIPPDNASGNFVKVVQRFPVRIELSSTRNDNLLPGMSVTVQVRHQR